MFQKTAIAMRYVALLMVLSLAGGCAVSQEQELQMGRDSHAKFEKEFGGIYPDQQVQRYVNAVGMDMAKYAGRPQMNWQYHVLNSNQVNAFAVPGGYIYITQGLLFKMKNEAQLAGVLAHETAHIAHRDSVQQIQRAQGAQGVAVLAGIFGGADVGDVASIVASLSLMKYSRDQEESADLTGLQYMTQGGYNPLGMVQVMKTLEDEAKGKNPPEFLSSHPNPGNRIEYLSQTINQKYQAPEQKGLFGKDVFEQQVLSHKK